MAAGHGDASQRCASGRVPVGAFVWFALAYAVLALAGRFTAVADRGTAVVWPAAGVAMLWLLARHGRAWSLASVGTLAGILATVHVATGAPTGLVVAATTAGSLQAVVAVALVRRWCPELLGAEGRESLAKPRRMLRFVGAAAAATLVGAAVGTAVLTALAAPGEAPTWSTFVLWWGRNLVGMLLIGTTGHLLLHALVTGERDRVRVPARRLPELGLVVLAGLASFVLIDVERGQPVAFLLIATGVWCALRFPTVVAALQVVATGTVAFVFTFLGHGPFSARSDAVDALTMQGFVLTLLLTTLAIGSTRDERVALLDDLREAQGEARERARFLETVTEAMSEGLVVMDADGTVLRMNDAARSLLGRTSTGVDQGTKTKDYVVLRPDGRVLTREEHPSVRALTEGRVADIDVVIPLHDGSTRTINVTATALTGDPSQEQERDTPADTAADTPEGDVIGTVSVYRDVTAERRHADQLAEFAATAAHDLRSPLTALRGWLELAADTDDPAVVLALEKARAAAARMQDLITDLLDQAAAEGAVLRPDELVAAPLDHVLDELLGDLGPDVAVHRADELPLVAAHPEMLRQLLTNLLGNAVKYTEPGVRPEITVTAAREGDRVAVEVSDNGIGIPEDQRSLVFERLHRAHAGDRRYDGTGLGLAICRSVVLRHGGHIECRAAPGGGTVFAFDLPAAVPDVPPIAPAVAPSDTAPPATAGTAYVSPVEVADPDAPPTETLADPAS